MFCNSVNAFYYTVFHSKCQRFSWKNTEKLNFHPVSPKAAEKSEGQVSKCNFFADSVSKQFVTETANARQYNETRTTGAMQNETNSLH
jgi:hypothetical protein